MGSIGQSEPGPVLDPYLDGSLDSQRWGTVLLTFVGQSTMYLPLLVKKMCLCPS